MLKKERNSLCRINEGVIELSLTSDSFALLCTKQIRLNIQSPWGKLNK